jgi:hypothetical protein
MGWKGRFWGLFTTVNNEMSSTFLYNTRARTQAFLAPGEVFYGVLQAFSLLIRQRVPIQCGEYRRRTGLTNSHAPRAFGRPGPAYRL